MWMVALALLAAEPQPLPTIRAPLGHVGGAVEPLPEGGLNPQDQPVVLATPTCEPTVVYLTRYVGGTLRALEQLQQWLDRAQLEKRLFKRPGVLGEVLRHVSEAHREPKKSCAPLALEEGFKLGLTEAPKKLCAAPVDQATGDFWFMGPSGPAAVTSVVAGSPEVCKPRLSVVLFDPRGQARVRVHSDWGGAISANLLGDSGQCVDFSFREQQQEFVATLRACKR